MMDRRLSSQDVSSMTLKPSKHTDRGGHTPVVNIPTQTAFGMESSFNDAHLKKIEQKKSRNEKLSVYSSGDYFLTQKQISRAKSQNKFCGGNSSINLDFKRKSIEYDPS